MFECGLIWVVRRMHVEVDHYPAWYEVLYLMFLSAPYLHGRLCAAFSLLPPVICTPFPLSDRLVTHDSFSMAGAAWWKSILG